MEENGVPWHTVAERVGPPSHIPPQDTYLPTIPVLHFLREMVIRQNFPEMSALVSLGDDGEIKLPLQVTRLEADFLSAPSLYAGLQAICSGSAKYRSRLHFWLRETDRNVWLCSQLPLSCFERGHEQQVQSRVIRAVGLIERYLGYR
jgi:hypothetical protein